MFVVIPLLVAAPLVSVVAVAVVVVGTESEISDDSG